MNQKKLGIVVIVKKKYIKGVITDGDLRRELKRFNNRENLNKYMSKNPYAVNDQHVCIKSFSNYE